MPSGLDLVPLARHGGAVSGGHGFYDPRSWLITFGILGLIVAFGWLLRRPVRRRRRQDRQPPSTAAGNPERREAPDARHGRVRGPDDDEDFLRQLEHRFPPPSS